MVLSHIMHKTQSSVAASFFRQKSKPAELLKTTRNILMTGLDQLRLGYCCFDSLKCVSMARTKINQRQETTFIFFSLAENQWSS
jgi:hypothetical protein